MTTESGALSRLTCQFSSVSGVSMSYFEHLEALRRQNKKLLQKLNHKPENLHLEYSKIQSKTPEIPTGKSAETSALDRTRLTEIKEGLLNVSGETMNLAVCEKSLKLTRFEPINSRNTAEKPEALDSLNSETCVTSEMASGCLTGEKEKRVSEETICDRVHVPVNPTSQIKPELVTSQDTGQQMILTPAVVPHEDEDDAENESESETPRLQPLLGYDWIAGLLDAESSLSDRSQLFFSELRTFRQINSQECIHSATSRLPDSVTPWSLSLEDNVTNRDHSPDSHQCTFCYRINNRLFAAPLDPRDECPVCGMPKEEHPHTQNQPAFIRVSIPRATLLPAYHYKAHRRCSFDPSDSLDLPSHCLSGRTNISMGVSSNMSSLDLRNSMEIRPNPGTAPSVHDGRQRNLSGSWASDRLPEPSRLARYRFQHGTNKPFY